VVLLVGLRIKFHQYILTLGQLIEREMSLAQREANALECTGDIDRLADADVAQAHLNSGAICRGDERGFSRSSPR
jgi:hypothetical protein